MMSNISELIQLCRAGVYIGVDNHKAPFTLMCNQHKDYYQDPEHYIRDLTPGGEELDEVPRDVIEEMIKRDTIIELQFYPRTPVGFYKIYHYDIDAAIEQALEIARKVCK